MSGGASGTEVPTIDAHVHFWDASVLPYPWLGSVPPLQRSFLPRDYPGFRDASAAWVDAVLVVEANPEGRHAADEVRWVEQLSRQVPRIAGIVAYVDLLDDASREARLERLPSEGHVVGVRHNIQGHAPGWALQPSFVAGVQAVGRHGFPFDLCATASQLPEVTQLVQRCPGVRFVLDHCGKPAVRDGDFATWCRDVAALARAGDVWCKLSGLLTEAAEGQRTLEALAPYLTHAIDTFGIRRVLYGSDWPVCTLAGDVAQWRALVSAAVGLARSAGERDAVFGGNAMDAYRFSWPRTSA